MCYSLGKAFLAGFFFGTTISLVAALIAYLVAKERE